MDQRWISVCLLCLGTLISYIDRGNLAIAAPSMARDFGFSPIQTGTLLSAFFWTYAVCQIPAGYLVDRFGIKRSFAVALALWSLASASVGLVSGFWPILALRMVLGVCEAIGPVASIAYIKRSFAPEEQGLPTGVYVAGALVGPGAGAMVGAALVEVWGWRAMFLLTGLVGLVWLVPWLALVRPPPKGSSGDTGGFSFGIALKTPLFLGIALGAFFYSYFWYFILAWVPSYLVTEHGMSNLRMGATVGLPLTLTAATNLAGGWLADRFIRRGHAPLYVRKCFLALGFILASSLLVLPWTRSSHVMTVFLVAMCGMGFATGNYWATTHLLAPPRWIGRVIGFQNLIAQTAGIVAPMLTGWLVSEQKVFTTAILFAGVSPLIAILSIATLIRPATIDAWQRRARV